MKKSKFWILGIVLALFASAANAQSFGAQSDTISYPLRDSLTNGNNSLQDFGPINNGQTQCHTIYLKNTGSDPLIIQTVSLYSNNGFYNDFKVTPIPTLPTILLHNEIVSIADLCYTPTNPTVTSEKGNIVINGTSGSKSVYLTANFNGSQIVDPLLLKPCIDSITLADNLFGPIIMDGDISQTVTLRSNRYDSLWVTGDTEKTTVVDPPFFTSGITFPYHLAPLEVKKFNVTFSPRSNVPKVQYRYVGTLSLVAYTTFIDTGYKYFSGRCSPNAPVILAGVAIPPTADSVSTTLAAGSTDVLAMISDNSLTTQTFHFTNTGTTNLKITGVSVKNGKSFAITDIKPTNTLPFILTPGQSMSVTVAMTTVTNGVYYDEVIITAENALISMDFQLQGLRKNGTQASVKTNSEQHLAIYPNPSHGEINVEIPGIRNAQIEVIDLLARVVTKDIASEKWSWKSNAAPGTYILHIIGSDAAGKTFQSYDRFIIQN